MIKARPLAILAVLVAGPALAQPATTAAPPAGGTVTTQPNTTGNTPDVVISRGGTGAETATTNSAAGGNAGQPERGVPQGSANGGGSSR
ncbi:MULTISPECIES: hypothetical protein [Methylobacterium]|jgi:hypothetical protein|uniref:Uncharacterized protein n=1 Tax=Methylobacterium hispanicum TaxID=270350 RepID=A0AAV4ZQH3_9HYPH|nr:MULTISPECIES: hypothetical protein [Methylobacterium]GJD90462.1 hypothetical protein BHAOGJBA_4001 [Methylobacterium hispanicum]